MVVAIAIVGFSGLFPIDPMHPSPLSGPASTWLGFIWLWLKTNHDPIESAAQVASAAGVLVAVSAYWRSKHLDQVDWIRQVYLDIEGLHTASSCNDEAYRKALDYYSIIFGTYKSRLVNRETWNIVRMDLMELVQDPGIVERIKSTDGRIRYPPEFISYLEALMAGVTKAKE